MQGRGHALCKAHHLRELRPPIEKRGWALDAKAAPPNRRGKPRRARGMAPPTSRFRAWRSTAPVHPLYRGPIAGPDDPAAARPKRCDASPGIVPDAGLRLSSDEAAWLTGTALTIDRALTAHSAPSSLVRQRGEAQLAVKLAVRLAAGLPSPAASVNPNKGTNDSHHPGCIPVRVHWRLQENRNRPANFHVYTNLLCINVYKPVGILSIPCKKMFKIRRISI